MTKEKIAELEEYAKEDLMHIKNGEDQAQFLMRKERKKTAEKALEIINELQTELDLVKLDKDARIEINAELKAENEKMKSSMEWQPIETAPKDGAHILVINGIDGCGNDGSPFYTRPFQIGVVYRDWDWISNACADDFTTYAPTHWMPLPKSPQIKE